MRLKRNEIAHLYNRAAFGMDFQSFQEQPDFDLNQAVSKLFDQAFKVRSLDVMGQLPQLEISQRVRSGEITREEARELIRESVDESKQKIRELNTTWITQMHREETAGLEKLVFFWHNHFGVRVLNGFLAEGHNNTLRKYALGSFRDLLLAVAKDPAMLNFLNNQQNNKAKPNENFARELMELFTIGRGNYSEKDVKESARAFTGWKTNRRTGEFLFDRRNHDFGNKEFFGKSGDFDGEDIVDTLLEDKRTATFLAKKFYTFYVEDQANESRIKDLADFYYKSNYHTGSLLKYLFSQEWFYDRSVQRAKIKSPIELINSLQAQMGLSFANPLGWIALQRNLDQVLFYPPSVAGWPQGREWIDSSSLVKRMQMAAALAGLELDSEELPEVDAADPFRNFDRKRVLKSASILKDIDFTIETDEYQVEILVDYLLGGRIPENLYAQTLTAYQEIPRHLKSKWLLTTLASLPEFQMI